jgi:ribosomal protein S6
LEKQANKKLYEAMFLVGSSRAARDWDGTLKAIRTILERAGCRIVSLDKWDERKLAYEVRGHGRGTYILSFFEADASRISGIERDVLLSERILRALVLRVDSRHQAPAPPARRGQAGREPVDESKTDKDDDAGKGADEYTRSPAEGAAVDAEQGG